MRVAHLYKHNEPQTRAWICMKESDRSVQSIAIICDYLQAMQEARTQESHKGMVCMHAKSMNLVMWTGLALK